MFEVPTKVEYGLLIMTELAKADLAGIEYISLQDIATKHNVSAKYLSQLAVALRQAKLVDSKEGKYGGYHIAQSPNSVTLRDIVEAIDGPLELVRCMDTTVECPAEATCHIKPIWKSIKQDMYIMLQRKTLAELV